MKIILFSDIHLQNYKQYHEINKDGLNSRMLIGIDVLRQIREYAVNNQIKIIVFTGDLFNNGSVIQPDLLTELIKELSIWKDYLLTLVAIPGQHDYHALSGKINSVSPLFDYVDIIHNGFGRQFKDLWVSACWHCNNIEDQIENLKVIIQRDFCRYKLLIGHFLVKELLEKNSAPFDPDCVSFSDLPTGFDLYALGDYHPHVWIPELKLLSVGVTHQHDFRDKNCVGSFIVYDFETRELKRIYIDAPQFIEVEVKDVKKMNKDDFYQVKVSSKEDEKLLIDIPSGVKFNVSREVIIDEVSEENRISDLHFNMDKMDIVRRYLEFMGKSEDKELMAVGNQYLDGRP